MAAAQGTQDGRRLGLPARHADHLAYLVQGLQFDAHDALVEFDVKHAPMSVIMPRADISCDAVCPQLSQLLPVQVTSP